MDAILNEDVKPIVLNALKRQERTKKIQLAIKSALEENEIERERQGKGHSLRYKHFLSRDPSSASGKEEIFCMFIFLSCKF